MNRYERGSGEVAMIGIALVVVVGLVLLFGSFSVVDPGYRGIAVTMGSVSNDVRGEGVSFKTPLFTDIVKMSIRQESFSAKAPCFSSDMQTMGVNVTVLYRLSEERLVDLFKNYNQNIVGGVIEPKLQESLKEVTAMNTAEGCVKNREKVKIETLRRLKEKVANLATVDDVIIVNIDLSQELEKAIEQKMVQEQEAAKAKFKLQQAEVDAQTAVVRAEGEAKAIRVRSDALKDGKGVVELMIAEKWNGVSPLVVGGGNGANILLPLGDRK
jgi:prohibitin 2